MIVIIRSKFIANESKGTVGVKRTVHLIYYNNYMVTNKVGPNTMVLDSTVDN